jgi:hypothetical protein
MPIQRGAFITPAVVAGAVTPTSATVIAQCSNPLIDVRRLYVRLTTAQTTDPLIIAWMSALRNSGFLSVWAAPPVNSQTWALAANHAAVGTWYDAVCGMMHTPFIRMIQGVLMDIRPWRLGGGWNATARQDFVTLQGILWTKATTWTAPWNPPGNFSLLHANTFNHTFHEQLVSIGGVDKVIDRECEGHQQVIIVGKNDQATSISRVHGHLSTAKTVPWQNVTFAFSAEAVGAPDVPDATATMATWGSKTAVDAVLDGLTTYFTTTQAEVKVDFLAMDSLTAWDAIP